MLEGSRLLLCNWPSYLTFSNPLGYLFYASTQSDLPSFFCRKDHFVCITFSSRDNWTEIWCNSPTTDRPNLSFDSFAFCLNYLHEFWSSSASFSLFWDLLTPHWTLNLTGSIIYYVLHPYELLVKYPHSPSTPLACIISSPPVYVWLFQSI